MTPDDRKSAVDDELSATRDASILDVPHRDLAGRDLAGRAMHDLGGDAEEIRTPWRWAAAAIVVLAAAAEIAWFVDRAGGSDSERRRTVVAMPPTEQAALAAKFERFQKLETAEQQRLRNLHAALEAEADPEALRATLARYETWIARLPPQVSAQLVGLPPTERAGKVSAIVAEQKETAAKSFGDADSKVLVAWLEKQVRGHQDEMMSQLPQTMRERLDNMGSRERTWALMLFAVTSREPGGSMFQKLWPAATNEMQAELSPPAQNQWNAVAGNPEGRKQLVRQAMERHMSREAGPATRITDVQLMDFFDRELSEEDRARLVALPREEMMSQLRREYYRRKGLWRDGYWRGDGRRPGGDDRMQGNTGDGGPGGPGGPRSFGPRPGGGFGPRPGSPGGPGEGNPGGNNPGGPGGGPGRGNPGGGNPGGPRPNGGNTPPPPKPQA